MERLEQRRAVRRSKEAEGRGPRTPEERDAARREARKAKAAQRTRYRARLKTRRAERRSAAPVQEPDHAPEHGPGRAKERTGLVVSDKADKTIIVRVDYQRRHKRYRKILRSSVTLHAHDERNDANAGDTVRVQECRPMSRSKRWRLVGVLERAK
jgi:small subunit ribosomal protein S17